MCECVCECVRVCVSVNVPGRAWRLISDMVLSLVPNLCHCKPTTRPLVYNSLLFRYHVRRDIPSASHGLLTLSGWVCPSS